MVQSTIWIESGISYLVLVHVYTQYNIINISKCSNIFWGKYIGCPFFFIYRFSNHDGWIFENILSTEIIYVIISLSSLWYSSVWKPISKMNSYTLTFIIFSKEHVNVYVQWVFYYYYIWKLTTLCIQYRVNTVDISIFLLAGTSQ